MARHALMLELEVLLKDLDHSVHWRSDRRLISSHPILPELVWTLINLNGPNPELMRSKAGFLSGKRGSTRYYKVKKGLPKSVRKALESELKLGKERKIERDRKAAEVHARETLLDKVTVPEHVKARVFDSRILLKTDLLSLEWSRDPNTDEAKDQLKSAIAYLVKTDIDIKMTMQRLACYGGARFAYTAYTIPFKEPTP